MFLCGGSVVIHWYKVLLADKLDDLLLQDCLFIWFEGRLSPSCGRALTRVHHFDAPLSLSATACRKLEEYEPGSQWIFKPVIIGSPPQDVK